VLEKVTEGGRGEKRGTRVVLLFYPRKKGEGEQLLERNVPASVHGADVKKKKKGRNLILSSLLAGKRGGEKWCGRAFGWN